MDTDDTDDELLRVLTASARTAPHQIELPSVRARARRVQRRRHVATAFAAVLAVALAGSVVVTQPWRSGESRLATDAAFSTQMTDGSVLRGWLSSTPDEVIVEVGQTRFVASMTNYSVSPYDSLGISVGGGDLIATGALVEHARRNAAVVTVGAISDRVATVEAELVLPERHALTVEVVDDRPAGRVAVAATELAGGMAIEMHVVRLVAKAADGTVLEEMYVRLFPLEAECGNFTTVGGTTPPARDQRYATPGSGSLGRSQMHPLGMLPLRVACAEDRPR